jgi:hypothetical protein
MGGSGWPRRADMRNDTASNLLLHCEAWLIAVLHLLLFFA